MNEAKRRETTRSEEKRSRANIYFSGMSELNARIEASVVILKPVYSTEGIVDESLFALGFERLKIALEIFIFVDGEGREVVVRVHN